MPVKVIRPEGELDEATEHLVCSDYDDLIDKYDSSKDPPYVPPTLVKREQWGAVPPKYREPLCTPATTVLILDTRSEFCLCQDTCSIVLKKLQHHYMVEKGLPDIPWNFMIAEDGRVYEGRGWVTNADKTLPETEKYHCRSLDIAYIGNYQVKPPSDAMSQQLRELIRIGETKCVIDGNHEMKSELMNDFIDEMLANKAK